LLGLETHQLMESLNAIAWGPWTGRKKCAIKI